MTAFLDEYMAVDESGADSDPVVEDDRGTEIPEYVRINLEHAELTASIASLSQELTERRAEAMTLGIEHRRVRDADRQRADLEVGRGARTHGHGTGRTGRQHPAGGRRRHLARRLARQSDG